MWRGMVAPTSSPTPTRTPSPTPTPAPQALSITAKGYGQDGIEVGYAFIIENPNKNLVFENSQYQVAFYDDAGTVLETDSGYIEVILPGERVGIASNAYLSDGEKPSRFDVQLRPGRSKSQEPTTMFTVENAVYRPDRFSPKVTAIVKSSLSKDITQVRTSVVACNAAGEIIGGGFTYVDFVPANGQAAAEILVTMAGTPAKSLFEYLT